VATAIFAWRGIVDYKLGLILGVTMFLGVVVGGNIATWLSAVWLRRIFLIAVVALALPIYSFWAFNFACLIDRVPIVPIQGEAADP
jgi:uncharacterized membrane protein YfcA